MKDKYMRVWDVAGAVSYIVTDDTYKGGLEPAPGVPHQGEFKKWTSRWAAVKALMLKEHQCEDYCGLPSYRFPLDTYVAGCEFMHATEINPFPRIKPSQVVTTYEDPKDSHGN